MPKTPIKKPFKNTKIKLQSGSARPLGASGDSLNVQNSQATLTQTAPVYGIGEQIVSKESFNQYEKYTDKARTQGQAYGFFYASLFWVLIYLGFRFG